VSGQRLLWGAAEAVLPQRNVGLFNQALMELGSTVCLAKGPRCEACPVALLCRACALGTQAEIPAGKTKRPIEARREAAVMVCRRGRVLIVRCAEGGRWAGLWDFPRFPVEQSLPEAIRRELADKVYRQTGVRIAPGEHLTTLKHGVTRFRITLDCYRAAYVSGPAGDNSSAEFRWVRPDELDQYPLNATGRKLSRLL
jgi:A/G-specific adenine glycosylase